MRNTDTSQRDVVNLSEPDKNLVRASRKNILKTTELFISLVGKRLGQGGYSILIPHDEKY